MAMGIVNSDSFDAEIASFNKPKVEVLPIKRGRGNVNEVPEALRKVIAEEAIVGKTISEIEEAFKVSPSSVSAYKNGATSTTTYNKPDENLNSHVLNVKRDIATDARSKIIEALTHITSDKLSSAKLKDVAGVAKDMAAVMEKMEGNNSEGKILNQVIIYAPRMREEQEYEVIDVSA